MGRHGMANGEMSERLAKELAAITQADQIAAATNQLGQMLHDYHKGLLDSGFTRVEALHLTSNYQTALVMVQSAGRERDS